jgi:hypothetical protein
MTLLLPTLSNQHEDDRDCSDSPGWVFTNLLITKEAHYNWLAAGRAAAGAAPSFKRDQMNL